MTTPQTRPCTFLAELPPGYDENAVLTLGPGNQILVTHPEHPALRYDEQHKEWARLDAVPRQRGQA